MVDQAISGVPEALAARFAKAFSAFVEAVRAAVADAAARPGMAGAPALLSWQTQALPRLEQQNASIKNAMALFLIGEVRSILPLAADMRSLARNLDGFPLDFAGPDSARVLDQLETAVVVAAYQVCAAAGIP
jgi:hypothetical protein